jgi:hypothetical protein
MRGEGAALWRSADQARIAGLSTCGSVWTCPVCSAKVCEARRDELTRALAAWSADGGTVALLTVTFPHQLAQRIEGGDTRPAARLSREVDELRDRVERFAKALSSWKSARAYKGVMEAAERAGSVRSLEVTVGDRHGWHPHTHDLVFLRRPLAMFTDQALADAARRLGVEVSPRTWSRLAAELRADPQAFERAITDDYRTVRDAWIAAAMRAGLATVADLAAMRLHSVDLRDGTHAAEYVAKYGREAGGWSLASELTRPHAKLGRARLTDPDGHYTPFELLAAAADGDAWSGFRFRAFAEVFTGRRMLSWSPGLRRELARLDASLSRELDDQALAEAALPDEQLAGTIDADQLRIVTARGMLGELLDYVAAYQADQAAIDAYIADLDRTIPPRWGDTLRRRRTYGAGYALIDS